MKQADWYCKHERNHFSRKICVCIGGVLSRTSLLLVLTIDRKKDSTGCHMKVHNKCTVSESHKPMWLFIVEIGIYRKTKELKYKMNRIPDYFQQPKPLCSVDLILLDEVVLNHQFCLQMKSVGVNNQIPRYNLTNMVFQLLQQRLHMPYKKILICR